MSGENAGMTWSMEVAESGEGLIAHTIASTLGSPNESDSNGEAANVVDGLYFIGRAIYALAEAIEKSKE